eukprot:gene14468-16610_t
MKPAVRFLATAGAGSTKVPIGIVQTTTSSIYTTTELDPQYDLTRWGPAAKTLFSMHPSYIHPSELNYGLPTNGVPEFAFVGRSNVGKSSLIDALMGNRKLVNVSKEPGCTRSINYYGLSKEKTGKDFSAYFVDLPGYGFARKSKEEQQKWTNMIHQYVSSRDQSVLRRVFVLVDSRRGINNHDATMMDTLNKTFIPYQIVFTKVDLTSKQELYTLLGQAFSVINSSMGGACLPFIPTLSTVDKTGLDHFKLTMGEIYGQKWDF